MNIANYPTDLLDDDNFSEEVLGIERLEHLATELARELKLKTKLGKEVNLLPEVKKASDDLLANYLHLSKELTAINMTPASEWFLDNFHIIEDQLRSIKRDLPKNFYNELPKISEGEFSGYPRVYALAHTFVLKTDCRLDLESIIRFVKSSQKVSPLTTGELWAIAITFRISLIKRLHPLVERIIFARHKREEADFIADKILYLATKKTTNPADLVDFLSKSVGQQERINRPLMVQLIQRLREQDPSISKAFDWLEETLQKNGTSTAEIVRLEHYRQAAAQVTIGNIISSMRLISKIDWHDFFEEVSLVDPILKNDPAASYHKMDRATRDCYRKIIERIAKRSSASEIEVAQKSVELAGRVPLTEKTSERKKHVGYFLIDNGVLELEKEFKYRSPLSEKIIRFVDEDPGFIYFGSMSLLFIFFMSIILWLFPIPDNDGWKLTGVLVLLVVPISDLSVSTLNYVITLIRLPKRLPRMETGKGLCEHEMSMVVVPCLLSNPSVINELINNIEVQYLANQDPHLYYAILGDLGDASTETTDKDKDYLALAYKGIEALNRRYQAKGRARFYLFHRSRLFNPSEGKFICWERKRGKILEFNRLLRSDKTTTFIDHGIDFEFLKKIKYVITLDADTQLPLKSACQLIGTITHPLNLPVIDPKLNRVVAGYGILQPRISVSIVSAAKTRFSKIFSGNTGIDPYTNAVSDVYQDLFNEGSFTGKGLYVVDAFEAVIGDRVPENCVLSHDLLEGSYARVGLTTDLELIDDFPSTFETYAKRMHRWTRGDWQVALWLLPWVRDSRKKIVRNNLSFISRWKIFDNLRRSLLNPILLLWLVLSWTVLWGNPFAWTLVIAFVMGFPVYAPTLVDLFRRHENTWGEHIGLCRLEIRKRVEQIVFMFIFMPSIVVDQLDAIIRSSFRMFVSKKHMLEWVTFSQTQNQVSTKFGFKEIITSGPIFAGLTTLLLLVLKPVSLFIATPFIIAWASAPFISRFTKERAKPKRLPLGEDDLNEYRRYGRMTWRFFETFAGADNNWLAPDNFQEDPLPVVARRTSPTNIGLHYLAILSAYDLGYIGFRTMVELLEKTMMSMLKLERMEGHLFNWYDTTTLEPLRPRYISVVDSGNLAGHLIVLKQAVLKLSEGPFESPHLKRGFGDNLYILKSLIEKQQKITPLPKGGSFKLVLQKLHEIKEYSSWEKVIAGLEEVHVMTSELVPVGFAEIPAWIETSILQVKSYMLDAHSDHGDLPERLNKIAVSAQEFYLGMNFKFLFDEERKIFAIGFNATDGRRDDSYYDLLASESRLASFFAIAKGDVSSDHWFRLGRSLTSVVGSRALISWSATMFEYLMPLLVMRRYEETLLDQTYDTIVLRQIEYGDQRQIPWGVSEAGYNARDLNFNYQYGPFGIPGLGLKRGLRDELVISPYSTMLAAMVLPKESLINLRRLEESKVLGQYGFYESVDYTPERLPKGQKSVILKSYMAHHQGMSLISINNLVNKAIMQRRFHAEPRVKAVQLLLQERIPVTPQIAKPRAEETHVESFANFSENHHTRSYSDPALSTPRTHILSNGNYSVMMTSAGSGFSKCEDRMVTRWKEDPTQDNWGQFIYIQDMEMQKVWSAGLQPLNTKPKKYEVHFSEDKIEIVREDNGIVCHTEVIVSCEDNVEMRRVTLTNFTNRIIELEVTSYMEVVLARSNDDAAHPAFSNLFIQTEFHPETSSLLANRRLRSKNEREVWGLHAMTVEGETVGPIQYETDRSRFLGRGRSNHNPIVFSNEIELSQTIGPVLDPIFSLRRRVKIKPYQTVRIIYSTGLVFSREEALRVSEKYHDQNTFLRQVNLGWVKAQIGLRHLNITMEKAHIYQRLGGRILYLAPYLRAQSQVLMANKRNQSALWGYGISGDIPILLTRIHDEKDMDMIRELLRGHEYLRLRGLKIDLVILNEHATSYMQNLQDELMRQILISGFHYLLDKPGGIFIRKADQVSPEDLVLLKSVARLSLFANKGTLVEQLRRRPHEDELPMRFVPTLQKKNYHRSLTMLQELQFFNGLGGFTPDGREYVITLKADHWTPAPWVNVVANKKDFGFIVSESGSGYTWSENSRENRLSTWSNDPVSDPVSEAIYIRDEETGEFWSPVPLPIRGHDTYVIHHGQGYSQFNHESHGFIQELTMFVPLDDTVKIARLTLKNNSGRDRKISVTSYIDWVLGFSRAHTTQTLTTVWDQEAEIILAKNTYNNEFAHRVAFMTQSGANNGFTCDRKEFVGRNGSMKKPAAMERASLGSRSGGGIDPCGAIQSFIEVRANATYEVIILLGQGSDELEAKKIALKYREAEVVSEALSDVKAYWDETLSTISIKTPDASMNMLVNRWLLYQTLSCRIWARSAFYQSGGAFGYRDQLQDVMAMVYSHPEITRAQIKLAASRQFPEGDVQHWWHPPTGRGVRTRFSDDLLWLPFVTNYYVEVTGDVSILDEMVPFIETPVLGESHDETYTQPSVSDEKASVFDHCFRTIDRSVKVGDHGLPLMGSGDWNDGMSRVGNLGRGESVWMAWFLIKTLKGFIPLCELKNDVERATKYRAHIETLKANIEQNAWDGEWYLRAYFDNGEKMGSHENEECRIDAIAQSWSLISGAGDPARSKTALKAVDKFLINREDQIIKLFSPPFDKSSQDPGYIKGYLPGVRENGGQYTHAAIWTMMAYAQIGDGKTATELFSLINPINRSSTLTGYQKYKVEPYVISADIYAVSPHVGRGGWSWYTGSASWMYRSAIESILGLVVSEKTLSLKPCVPKSWEQFELTYRKGKTIYKILVLNNQTEDWIEMNGTPLQGLTIPLEDDGKDHQLIVYKK